MKAKLWAVAVLAAGIVLGAWGESVTRAGVVYARRGGLGTGDFVATNVAQTAADVGAVSTYAKFSEDTGSYLNWNYALKGLAFGFDLNDPQILITDAPYGEIRHPRRTDEKWDWLVTWDGSTLQDSLNSYVPTTRKINGQPLTEDLTIQGMPNNGLVWDEVNSNVKTADGLRFIDAVDVRAFSKDGGTITDGNSSVKIDAAGIELRNEYGTSGDINLYAGKGVQVGGWFWHGTHFEYNSTFLMLPYGVTGELAVNSWSSLRSMLTDATTNTNADRECISTNICKLIEPHIEAVNVVEQFWDAELEANWELRAVGGDLKMAVSTNEDMTVFQKANPVLEDKQTGDEIRLHTTGGELKFLTR